MEKEKGGSGRRASEEKGEASHGSYSADRSAARVISRARQTIDSDRLRIRTPACVHACVRCVYVRIHVCSRPQALSGGRKPGTRFVSSVGISQSVRPRGGLALPWRTSDQVSDLMCCVC